MNIKAPVEKVKIEGILEDRSVFVDGELLDPRNSQKVYNHSPDGFSWGYGGSGPAQLALAILLRFYNRSTAIKYYQDFKMDYIANLPQSNFSINLDIKQWMLNKQKEARLGGEEDGF